MTDTTLFSHYRPELARGAAAMYSQQSEVDRNGKYVLFYTPFEHENPDAELVVVGMTPGPAQLKLCYESAPKLLSQGAGDLEVLSTLKQHGAFGGPTMRPNLVKELEHFRVAQRLGLDCADDFWGIGRDSFYATSVVPHAAFHAKRKKKDGTPVKFTGSFQAVLDNEVLKQCFERHFLPQLARINRNARYIGLGSTPKAALRFAARAGVIDANQVLGAVAHPSTSGVNRVPLFLREVRADELKATDPALKNAAEYQADYDAMVRNVEAWRPCLKAAE